MRFFSPLYLLLLLPLLGLVLVWIWKEKKRKLGLKKYFSKESLKSLGLSIETSLSSRLSRWALFFALASIIVALARPQFGSRQVPQSVSENSVVFVLDLSRSMLTRDVAPSRIELLKTELVKTLKALGSVRVGLVVFAGNVEVISPMTADLGVIEDYVMALSTESVATQGTEVKTALSETEELFKRVSFSKDKAVFEKETKVIVLFSDGEDHEKETLKFTKGLSKKGYKIFTVGVGSEAGGFIPESFNSRSYIKDASMQPVVSKPNFKFLKELARIGGGAFFYLSALDPLGPKIKAGILKIQAVATSKKDFIVKNEVYQIFLIISALMICLSYFFRRLKK